VSLDRDTIEREILAYLPTVTTEDSLGIRAAQMRTRILDSEQVIALPPPEWLIENVLARDSLALLYGAPGSFKSFTAIDWTLSVATGNWWFGRRVEKAPTLYVAAEGAAGLGKRLSAWQTGRNTYQLDGARWYPEAVNLMATDWVEGLVEVAAEIEPGLVVLDTLSRSMLGADENSSRDMNLAIDAADRVRRACHACVLLVHHDTKAGGSPRGSSALLGAADTVIQAEGGGTTVTLTCAKQKDAEPFARISLNLVKVGESAVLTTTAAESDSMDDDEEKLLLTLLEIASFEAVSSSVLRTASGVSERTYYRKLQRLRERGYVTPHRVGRYDNYTISEQGKQAVLGQ
jgi:uncharacterized membrane protein